MQDAASPQERPSRRHALGTLGTLATACMAGLAAKPSLAQAPAAAQAPARRIDVQGHRGARGLMPESTLEGFERALRIGVTTLELDTGVSADGVVVVHHDRRLHVDHTRDASGHYLSAPGPLVRSLPLAELKRYDVGRARAESGTAKTFAGQQAADGARIPTLGEVFELTERLGAREVRFNIETKLAPMLPDETVDPETFTRAVLEVARRYRVLDRCCLQSFDWRTLRIARRMEPRLPTAHLSTEQPWWAGAEDGVWTDGLSRAREGSLPQMVRRAGGSIWSPAFADLNAERLAEAHRLGLKVAVWTVNQPADIGRMLDLGVDAIISDYPDRVRQALAERGWPLPPPVGTAAAR